jgi:hypothetical protein
MSPCDIPKREMGSLSFPRRREYSAGPSVARLQSWVEENVFCCRKQKMFNSTQAH